PVVASFFAISGISRLPGAEKNSIPRSSYPCLASSAVNASLHRSVISACHAACTYAIFFSRIGLSSPVVFVVLILVGDGATIRAHLRRQLVGPLPAAYRSTPQSGHSSLPSIWTRLVAPVSVFDQLSLTQ